MVRYALAVILLLSVCREISASEKRYPIQESCPELNVIKEDPIDSTFYERYPYVVLIDEGDDTEIDDDFFYSHAASVTFKVSKTDLLSNDKTFRELTDEVLPGVSRDSLRVVRMQMRGAASPEGPFDFNRQLGEGRLKALYNHVRERLQLPSTDNIKFETEIEDYNYLCRQMEQAGDKDYERVKLLYDRYIPNHQYKEMKRALQRMDGGKVWRRLLVTYFPSLRAARVIIICQKPSKPQVTEPPVPVDTVKPAPVEPWLERVPRRELLSVKTNMLFYGVYMPGGYNKWCPIPNIAIEYYPLHGHFTFGASYDNPWWQHYHHHKYFQIRNYQLETRYYMRPGDIELNPEGEGAAFKGWYWQAYVHAGIFGICFDENRGWMGEGIGAGVGGGYVLPISKKGHWRLEFQAQFGVFHCGYDPYQYENPVDPNYHDDLYYYKWTDRPQFFKKRQYRYTWVGPTRIGVTLSYDLLYRKASKTARGYRHPKATMPTLRYNPLVPYETRLNDGKEGGEQ